MEQFGKLTRAMEAGTISKNEASLKSLMSRENLKLFSTFFMVMVCAIYVPSCSKDDNNLGNSQDGKQLAAITNVDGGLMTFQYANGKLTQFYSKDFYVGFDFQTGNTMQLIYTYSGKKVTIADTKGTFEINLQLNNDGFVKSAVTKGIMNMKPYEYTQTFDYTNGYLTRCQEGNFSCGIQYDSNNNISTININDEYNRYNVIKCTPLNIPCSGKTFWIMCITDNDFDEFLFLYYYAGFLGKEPKNAISTIINSSGYSEICSYIFDNDNYIKSMDAGSFRNVSFTYK